MSKELVSIVIPIYNVKEYIDECVSSAVNQTYRNIEILLIDDGSSDGSSDKCEVWLSKDKRIKVIHKNNGGLSSARNCGMDNALGEFIYFLDSDDYIELNTIELLVNQCKNDQLDIVIFSGQCFWDKPQSDIVIESFKDVYKKSLYGTLSGPKIYIELKKKNQYYPAVPMHFYRKSFLENYNLRFYEGILHEDELFSILSYYYANRVGCCSQVLYWRRLREASIMTKKVAIINVESCFKIVSSIMQIIESNNNDNDKTKKAMLRLGLSHCLWLFYIRYNLLDNSEKKIVSYMRTQLERKLKKEKYYNSMNIFLCYIKKILIPLRNNESVYLFYKRFLK